LIFIYEDYKPPADSEEPWKEESAG
jgi:hypothetical protein